MEQEENVYGNEPKTEEQTEHKERSVKDKKSEERASTILGKFKDVDALARAYSALESEFTRRSQRLKELEKQAESAGAVVEKSGVEKLRETARTRKAADEAFDRFVGEVEQGVDGARRTDVQENSTEEITSANAENEWKIPTENVNSVCTGTDERDKSGEDTECKAGCSKENGVRAEGDLLSVESKERTKISSEQLLEQARQNEEVRLKIIGEYLDSLGKTGAPITAVRGGAAITPPLRAKSIDAAGDMALRYFKKGPQQE